MRRSLLILLAPLLAVLSACCNTPKPNENALAPRAAAKNNANAKNNENAQPALPVGLRSEAVVTGEGTVTVWIRVLGEETRVWNGTAKAGGRVVVKTDAPYVVAEGSWETSAGSTARAGDVQIVRSASVPAGAKTVVVPAKKSDTVILDGVLYKRAEAAPAAPAPFVTGPSASMAPARASDCLPAAVAAPLPDDCPPVYFPPACTRANYSVDPDGPRFTQVNNPSTTVPQITPGTGWPCDRKAAKGVAAVAAAPVGLVACIVKGITTTLSCLFSGGSL